MSERKPGFQEVIPKNVTMYGMETKFPTSAQMDQNNRSLALILAGTGKSEQDLIDIFHFTPDEATQIATEARQAKTTNQTDVPVLEYPWTNTRKLTDNVEVTVSSPNPVAREPEKKRIEATEEEIEANRARMRASLFRTKPAVEEVENGEGGLPSHERAFFMGLNVGKFQFEHIGEDDSRQLKIISSSDALRPKLEATLGLYGEVSDVPTQTTVYLNPKKFGFLGRKPRAGDIADRKDLTAFFLGLIHGKMSKVDHRITWENGLLLKDIEVHFGKYFREGLVEFKRERRRKNKGEQEDNTECYNVLTVLDMPQVVKFLLSEPGIKSLPFYPYLKDFYKKK